MPNTSGTRDAANAVGHTKRLIFVSYAHEDQGWISDLDLDKTPGGTEEAAFWIDSRGIHPGTRWNEEAQRALARASAAVLLISRHFLESKSIEAEELPVIMSRYTKGEISIVLVPIGKLDRDKVGKKLKLDNVHNIISVPAWASPLPTVPQRREDIRELILSAATETAEIQNLRRSLQPKYQLREKLPTGALGQAFLATDRQLQREVCIKLLTQEALYWDFHESLRKVANATDHTNILTIYGAYLDTNPPHFVRRYVRGDSLRFCLDERPGRRSARSVQAFLATIGGAVVHAHQRGVADLNVKPTNIIVTDHIPPSEQSFLISLNSYREELFLDDDQWRLRSKAVFYLPLEYRRRRRKRDEIDPFKADQYRIGLIAYEMMVGAVRFAELADGLRSLEFKPATWTWPSLDETNCECPEHLRSAVNRMISTDPEERFNSLADALQEVDTNLHVEIARESYRRMMETETRQTDLFKAFYLKLFDKYPRVREDFFGHLEALKPGAEVPKAWHRQFQLLKEAVLLLLVFSAFREDRQEPNILTRIAEEHAQRGIPGFLYSGFAEVLIDCIVAKDQLPESLDGPQLRRAWSNVVEPGIQYMKRKAEEFGKRQFEERRWSQKS